ncbi:antimicrobial peptide microplusin-like [Amblyomma americanum]|uniref:Uncharacterized protein n=1 Tax=Amblyomma americanum TaxID=6943 RepID=A0AAQ4F3W3_AMBAM
MKTSAIILVLALVAFLDCVAHESETCKLDDNRLQEVLTCVTGMTQARTQTKLDALVKEMNCKDFVCGVKKVCAEHNGDLEKGSKGSLTSEELELLRATFKTCLESF